MKIEEARQILKETMEAKFTDKTFRHYINESLAGDFAVEIATVIQNNTCQIGAQKQVIEERDIKIREIRELERSYTHQLGELARLCNIVGRWFFGTDGIKADPETVSALDEIMQYVEVVAPPVGSKDPEWFMHILGPDDVFPCVGEFDALRKANQHNRSWARLMANDPKPNDPYCVAVAVTKENI